MKIEALNLQLMNVKAKQEILINKSKEKILYHCDKYDLNLSSSLTCHMKIVHKQNELKVVLKSAEKMDVIISPLKKKKG